MLLEQNIMRRLPSKPNKNAVVVVLIIRRRRCRRRGSLIVARCSSLVIRRPSSSTSSSIIVVAVVVVVINSIQPNPIQFKSSQVFFCEVNLLVAVVVLSASSASLQANVCVTARRRWVTIVVKLSLAHAVETCGRSRSSVLADFARLTGRVAV